jgi:hypothetical protein
LPVITAMGTMWQRGLAAVGRPTSPAEPSMRSPSCSPGSWIGSTVAFGGDR